MFYPCHNNKNKMNINPSPKSIRRGCIRSLKFDTYTTHGLLAEFRGLKDSCHKKKKTKKQEPHQNLPTTREHTKYLNVAHRQWFPIRDLETKTQFFSVPQFLFRPKKFWDKIFFSGSKFFVPKIFLDLQFCWFRNFVVSKIFLTQMFFSDQIFSWTHNLFGTKIFS